MPQMSPMYWLVLMFYFMIILTFIYFNKANNWNGWLLKL